MKASPRSTALRKLLTLCDDVQRIRSRLADPATRREHRTRLRRQLRTKTDQLAGDLGTYRFRGPLGKVLRETKLEPEHFLVLAVLLQHRLRADEPSLDGRTILALVFDNSFDVLSGMDLLHENGRLRASGLVVLDPDEEFTDDVLGARFRISEEALVAFRDEVSGLVAEDESARGDGPYRSNREVLVDLRILHNLFRHRSERVFQADRWDRLRTGDMEPGRNLTRRIDRFWSKVQARTEPSADGPVLPAVQFIREHHLSRAEIVIVVALLFKEVYEGNAYADAAELIRLVSENEYDLLRNRGLMLPAATLRKAEIIEIETMIEGRELTGEVHLQDWVVNRLLAGTSATDSIRPDEQLDWHLYLKRISDTRAFYRDLEAN